MCAWRISHRITDLSKIETGKTTAELRNGLKEKDVQLSETRAELENTKRSLNETRVLAEKAANDATHPRLSAQQREGLTRDLRSLSAIEVNITSMMGDSDLAALAQDFREVFKAAGMGVGVIGYGQFTPPIEGLCVQIRNGDSNEIGDQILAKLRNVGIDVRGVKNNDAQANTIELIIGRRPKLK